MPNQFDPAQRVVSGATKVDIDKFNQWMRAQPWYAQTLAKFGGRADSDAAKTAVVRAAQAAGAQIDEGNMEVDNTGNLRGKGHKLRNTLIVAGIAGAALATAGLAGAFAPGAVGMAGGASGAGAAGAGGAGAAGLGSGTLFAGEAGLSAAGAAGAGVAAAAIPTSVTAALTTAGLSAPMIKQTVSKVTSLGLSPTLENILKYALPVGGSIVSGIVQSKSASSAQEAQQKYLEEALAYEKDKDKAALARNEERYQFGKGQEASRYADFSGRIAPYLATGASANDRMAALLGLPAGPRASGAMPPPAPTGMPAGPAPTAPTPSAPGQITTQPAPASRDNTLATPAQPQEPLVTMRAPTGQVQQVPASQKKHYEQQGAVEVAA